MSPAAESEGSLWAHSSGIGLVAGSQPGRRMFEDDEFFQLLFDKNPNPMWVFDRESLAFLEVNRAAISQYGYSRDEFLRMTLKDIRPPEDQPAFLEYIRHLLAQDIPPEQNAEGSWRHCKKDHTVIRVDTTWTPVSFKGRSAGLGLAHNITAHEQAEEALREREEWFRAIVEASPIPLLITRATDGQILYANEQLGLLIGIPSQALIGQKAPDFYDNPADRQTVLQILQRDGFVRNHEVKVKKADGTQLWVIGSGHYVTVGGKQVILSAYYNITDRKQMEEENRMLQEQLVLAQKMEAVGRLAGGIAHDFNNLLTVINGYSELLLQSLSRNYPQRQEVERIQEAGQRAAALTQQLLAFSRHQVQGTQVVNFNALVANMSTLLQRLLGEDVELTTSLDPTPGYVKADPGQLEQVIMNLAVNARDAMPHGGKLTIETVTVEINESNRRIPVVPPGRYLLLSVSDTGCGMDAETRVRIFEPFFTTKAVGKGTGLGLSIVYGIITRSGGRIVVYSELGHGSTFKIYLPRVGEEAESFRIDHTTPELPFGRERVLVVEDEPGVRALVCDTLRRHGYTVIEARHGIEGLILAAQDPEPLHLLITDVVMPQMNGCELTTRLIQARPGLKVLYMSGYTESAVVHRGIMDPGTAFLQKPFDLSALVRKVREVLDRG